MAMLCHLVTLKTFKLTFSCLHATYSSYEPTHSDDKHTILAVISFPSKMTSFIADTSKNVAAQTSRIAFFLAVRAKKASSAF